MRIITGATKVNAERVPVRTIAPIRAKRHYLLAKERLLNTGLLCANLARLVRPTPAGPSDAMEFWSVCANECFHGDKRLAVVYAVNMHGGPNGLHPAAKHAHKLALILGNKPLRAVAANCLYIVGKGWPAVLAGLFCVCFHVLSLCWLVAVPTVSLAQFHNAGP